jgi:hypothetical protein
MLMNKDDGISGSIHLSLRQTFSTSSPDSSQ